MKKFIASLLVAAGLPVILIWAIGPVELCLMVLEVLGRGLLQLVITAPWLIFL